MAFTNNQYGTQQPQPSAGPQPGGDARTLLKAGAAIAAPHKNPDPDGVAYAVVPEGFKIERLPERDYPARPVAVVKLRDAASFIEYVNAHKSGNARIYAMLEPAQFLAVLDDFGPAAEDLLGAANWRQWRAQFLVPMSREWQIWTKGHKIEMTQKAFGEFLQDNLPDVASPDGGTLLQMAMNFEASESGSFRSSQRLQDGSHSFEWVSEKNATGSVKLPPEITLAIPVFENDARYSMTARLRYRPHDGKLTLWYELVRPHKVLEAAFMDAWGKVKAATGVPLLLGSPE